METMRRLQKSQKSKGRSKANKPIQYIPISQLKTMVPNYSLSAAPPQRSQATNQDLSSLAFLSGHGLLRLLFRGGPQSFPLVEGVQEKENIGHKKTRRNSISEVLYERSHPMIVQNQVFGSGRAQSVHLHQSPTSKPIAGQELCHLEGQALLHLDGQRLNIRASPGNLSRPSGETG